MKFYLDLKKISTSFIIQVNQRLHKLQQTCAIIMQEHPQNLSGLIVIV